MRKKQTYWADTEIQIEVKQEQDESVKGSLVKKEMGLIVKESHSGEKAKTESGR